MNPKVKIRKANRSDWGQLFDLWYSFIRGGERLEPWFEELKPNAKQKAEKHFNSLLRDKKTVFFLAVCNKKIVGFISGDIRKTTSFYAKRQCGKISNFMVKKEFRSKGIGKKLFQGLQRWFKTKKARYIELNMLQKQTQLKKLYQKWGFHAISCVRTGCQMSDHS